MQVNFSKKILICFVVNNVNYRSNMNGNIITRRLCRNRQMDDNELYRSNSFKFEKFKRDEVISNCNTLPRPVSLIELLNCEH